MTTKSIFTGISIFILFLTADNCFSQVSPDNVTSNQAIGNYTVNVTKTNFYTAPDLSTKRKAYLIKGNKIAAFTTEGRFIYVEFQNTSGGITRGWLIKDDLLPTTVNINSYKNTFKSTKVSKDFIPFDIIYNIATSDSLYDNYFQSKCNQISSLSWFGRINGYSTYVDKSNNKEMIQFLDQYRSIEYTFASHSPDHLNYIEAFIKEKGFVRARQKTSFEQKANVKEIFTIYNPTFPGYSSVSINEIFTDGKRTGCEITIKNPKAY